MGSLILFLLFCQGGRLFGWGRLLGSEEYVVIVVVGGSMTISYVNQRLTSCFVSPSYGGPNIF